MIEVYMVVAAVFFVAFLLCVHRNNLGPWYILQSVYYALLWPMTLFILAKALGITIKFYRRRKK